MKSYMILVDGGAGILRIGINITGQETFVEMINNMRASGGFLMQEGLFIPAARVIAIHAIEMGFEFQQPEKKETFN